MSTDDHRKAYEQRLKDVIRVGLDSSIVIGDLNDLERKYNIWKRELPDITPFYAVKCNTDYRVLDALVRLGCSFDCASEQEIQLILSRGVDPSRIIYAHTIKAPSMLQFAAKHEVSLMTFDNEEELLKIKEYFPEATLILRIKATEDKTAKFNTSRKFGCPLENARCLLETAKRSGLNVSGTSFYIGSNASNASVFTAAIRDARRVHDIAVQLGFDMRVLDIGGGFPGHSESASTFRKFARTIREALPTYFGDIENIRIIAEPGRFFVESAFTLCLKVIGKTVEARIDDKHKALATQSNKGDDKMLRDQEMSDTVQMYYLSDGIHGFINMMLFISADDVEFHTVNDLSERSRFTSILWGPTCSNVDLIKDGVFLPELHIGDWLYIRDVGAYWGSVSRMFNGMPSPTVHHVNL